MVKTWLSEPTLTRANRGLPVWELEWRRGRVFCALSIMNLVLYSALAMGAVGEEEFWACAIACGGLAITAVMLYLYG